MNCPLNDARVTARIPHNVKKTIQEAADLSSAILNQFLVQAALKEAQQILEARVMALSQKDAQTVFSLWENPPEPNPRLKAAVEKHKAFFLENH